MPDTYLCHAVSEIAVSHCTFSPGLTDFCQPATTSEQDAIKGKWVRVAPNLNMESGVMSGYLASIPSPIGRVLVTKATLEHLLSAHSSSRH